jgi:hypothetical protein
MDSKVRQWTEQRQQELKYSTTLSHEDFFAVIMYGLANFGKPITDEKLYQELQRFEPDTGLDASKYYGGDASLFELGCYLYVCIDLWLFSQRPHLRNGISLVYVREFVRLFSTVLGSVDVYELFYQRVKKYGELVRIGEFAPKEGDVYNFLSDLTELILRTRDNALPISYIFGHEPLTLSFEAIGVKMRLILWIETMLPAILESLEKYCFPQAHAAA